MSDLKQQGKGKYVIQVGEGDVNVTIHEGSHAPPTARPEITSLTVGAHLTALATYPEYARWSEQGKWLEEQGMLLPIYGSPYDQPSGDFKWYHENLLTMIRASSPIIVLGEPGAGKTTALERLVWEMATASTEATSLGLIPVVISLRSYTGDLKRLMWAALNITKVLPLSDETDLERFLQSYPCCFMFDGLNETPRKYHLKLVSELDEFIKLQREPHHYIFTSRSQDDLWKQVRAVLGEQTPAIVVQPIQPSQARQYLMAWLGQEPGEMLYNRLDEQMRGLAQRPLLLWMIKESGVTETLPTNRGELVASFVKRMLAREAKLGEKAVSISAPLKKKGLTILAWQLQNTDTLQCNILAAIKIINAENDLAGKGEQIVQEARVNGLLMGEEKVRFLHQVLQEHFAAVYMQPLIEQELQRGKVAQFKRAMLRKLTQGTTVNLEYEKEVRERTTTELSTYINHGFTYDGIATYLFLYILVLFPCAMCSICERAFISTSYLFYLLVALAFILGGFSMMPIIFAQVKVNLERLRFNFEHLKFNLRIMRLVVYYRTSLLGKNLTTYAHLHSQLLTLVCQDNRWNEVFIQLVGLTRSSDKLLSEIALSNPWLAYWCMIEGSKVNPATQQIIELKTVGLLKSPLVSERYHATHALSGLTNFRAESHLCEATVDKDNYVRNLALVTLANRWDIDTIGKLADVDEDIREKAVISLGKIVPQLTEEIQKRWGIKLLAEALYDQNDIALASAKALVKVGKPAVESLIKALRHEDSRMRISIVKALGAIGDVRMVEPLIDVLHNDKDSNVRELAILTLLKVGDIRMVELLIETLRNDKDSNVRELAILKLLEVGDIRMVELLIETLRNDKNSNVRELAILKLLEVGDIRMVEPLIETLRNDKNSNVREKAAESLGKIGDVRAIEPLIEALHDKYYYVRENVAEALGKIGDVRAIEPLKKALYNYSYGEAEEHIFDPHGYINSSPPNRSCEAVKKALQQIAARVQAKEK